MNRLKGTLNLYKRIDILYVFAPIIMASIGPFFRVLKNRQPNVNIGDFMICATIMTFINYGFSFSYRYFIFRNFNTSKKIFFNSHKLISVINSLFISLLGCLYFIVLCKICEVRNIQYSILIMGKNYEKISLYYLIIIFVIIFIYLMSMSWLGFLFGVINQKFINTWLYMSTIIGMGVVSDIIFNNRINIFYFVMVLFLFILIGVLSMKLSWNIFKKKDIEISDVYKSMK